MLKTNKHKTSALSQLHTCTTLIQGSFHPALITVGQLHVNKRYFFFFFFFFLRDKKDGMI